MFSDVKSLFSRNMNNFDIAAENTVRIAASKNSSEEIDFCLQPLNGKVVIRASDIAGNYSTPYDPHIENTSVFRQALDSITIQARDEQGGAVNYEKTTSVIFGGYDNHSLTGEIEHIDHNFLTWRPQVDFVVPNIKQQLTFVIYNTGELVLIRSRKISVKVYFKTTLPKVFEIGTFDDNMTLYRIDCSYQTIRELTKNVDDEIVAYDIFGAEGDTLPRPCTIRPQRFVVKESNLSDSYFFFQNTLGGFDTIVATGEIKEVSKGEVYTVSTLQGEVEVENAHIRAWEVNTGYISTSQEESLWREFLQSTNRYVLFRDGSQRQIVVEEYKAERTKLELGSFTFKYHYADKERGLYYQKSEELKEYIK